MDPELGQMREWAQEELDDLREPPWATGRYHHLIQAIDRILGLPPPPAASAAEEQGKVVHISTARRRVARNR